MKNQTTVRKRDVWVDDVKVIACVLVVLGHFFQSMVKSDILSDSDLYEWFNTTIYYFHVPLFFICSGYLYQKYSRVNTFLNWQKNIKKKVLALGIPYLTFTTATWILKKLFSGSVNDQIGGLGDTLLFHPTSPYWYLYALFCIFLITPTFRNVKKATIGLLFAFLAKVVILIGGGTDIYALSTVLSNEIWFVLGMCICLFNLNLKNKQKQGIIGGLLFILLSIVIYVANIHINIITFFMGLLACYVVIILTVDFEGTFGRCFTFLSKYTMPIFLMHTLFAAPMRSILIRIGIENGIVHILLGLGISFLGPIVATWIMKKSKWLEFFLYPNKFIKELR